MRAHGAAARAAAAAGESEAAAGRHDACVPAWTWLSALRCTGGLRAATHPHHSPLALVGALVLFMER
jgi:hypothetical protein